MSLTGIGDPSSTYKYPHTVPSHGRLTKLLPSLVKLCKHSFYFPVGSTCPGEQVPTFGAHRSCYEKQPAMALKRASSKAASSIDEAAKAALLAEKKKARPSRTTPPKRPTKMTLSAKDIAKTIPPPKAPLRTCSSEGGPQAPPPGFAPPKGEDTIEDGEVIGISAEDQLKLRALRIKSHNLQKQKEILEAKRQCVTMQAKVRQMIQDEEQRARELEQEIALMQGEGQYNLQRGPLAPLAPLQQRVQAEDPFILQRGPFIPPAATFQGINYLDERSPLAL
jgi:hypothetical protein